MGIRNTKEKYIRIINFCHENEDFMWQLFGVDITTQETYIGITQNHFVFATCLDSKYLYEFDYAKDDTVYELSDIDEYVYLRDIGHCFKLTDIEKCEFKKGMPGSVKCNLEFKDKSTFKLMLPKKAGMGNGMPNHTLYREQIIDCLKK